MRTAAIFSLAVTAKAATLRFGSNGGAKIDNTATGALHFGGNSCVDRSNWCGEFNDGVMCATNSAATAVTSNTFKSAGNPDAAISLFSDGTLRFSTSDGGCVLLDHTAPTTAEVIQSRNLGLSQLLFKNADGVNYDARIHLTAAGQMRFQAASFEEDSVTVVPPTAAPTPTPTNQPTDSPTNNPTDSPTNQPTDSPTNQPTDSPTNQPTDSPTNQPTDSPTNQPTDSPTNQPTDSPTNQPTANPTQNPTVFTMKPTAKPTTAPTTGVYASVSTTWCGPNGGPVGTMIASLGSCAAAANADPDLTFVSAAGPEWHAGCIMVGSNVFYTALSTRPGSHTQSDDGQGNQITGYLCNQSPAMWSATGCGNNKISNAAQCEAAATAATTITATWQSLAGSEWKSGCIIHNGGVYFSPGVVDNISDQVPNGGYLCNA